MTALQNCFIQILGGSTPKETAEQLQLFNCSDETNSESKFRSISSCVFDREIATVSSLLRQLLVQLQQ
ncbi:hypothetical protein L2E82_12314 [Cichorium intybus]|uniref:Uncharacterized protein n=1 Tax=Cichorium intybus TaxID=13427 RepID=A0ACB9GF74_CICIN|nr:hypothetical protein L2E82_12314 [Cichorium intybus]